LGASPVSLSELEIRNEVNSCCNNEKIYSIVFTTESIFEAVVAGKNEFMDSILEGILAKPRPPGSLRSVLPVLDTIALQR